MRASHATDSKPVPRTSVALPGDCGDLRLRTRDELRGTLDAGAYDELEDLLTSYEQAYEENPLCEAHVWLSYVRLGSRKKGTRADLQRWAAARPESHHAHIALAQSSMSAGFNAHDSDRYGNTQEQRNRNMWAFFSEALEELEVAEAIYPYHLYSSAIVLAIIKASPRKEKADEVARRYMLHDPRSFIIPSRWIQAYDPRWGGSLSDVRRIATLAQSHAHENPRIPILLGYEHAYQGWNARDEGRHEDAIHHFSRALEFGDTGIQWRHARSKAYFALGRFDEAYADATVNLEIMPADTDLLAHRAWILIKSDRKDEALQDLDRLIQESPSYAWARRQRGWIHQQNERWWEAVDDYESALRREPDHAWMLRNAGYIHVRYLDDPKAGIPLLERSLDLDPANGKAWFYLARAQAQLGNDGAAASYRRVLELVDGDSEWETFAEHEANHFLSGGRH